MKLLAIDSNSILNRAFYGVRPLTTQDGVYTNGIYGFFNIFYKMMEEISPDAVVFAFDLKAPTFRHKAFDGYKAQRKGMPPELAMQLPYLKELIAALGYQIVTCEGYEADDILGTFAKACTQAGHQCIIATGDRDSLQLVDEQVQVRLATTKMGRPESTLYTVAEVQEKYGVTPAELIQVKALMGDSSDNIPGVAGIGEKTALTLIARYHDVDTVYASLDDQEIKPGVRTKLEAGREMCYTSLFLAKICCEVPIDSDAAHYLPHVRDTAKCSQLLTRLELYNLLMMRRPPRSTPAEASAAGPSAPAAPSISCSPATPAAVAQLADSAEKVYLLCRFAEDAVTGFAVSDGARLLYTDAAADADACLLPLLTCGKLYTYASKSLYRYAMTKQLPFAPVVFDAELAAYLISPTSSSYELERLLPLYQIPCALLDNAPKEDTLLHALGGLIPLCGKLSEKIEELGQHQLLYDIEQPLAEVLASMEIAGFALDTEGLHRFGSMLDNDLSVLEEEIYADAGERFNINSPKQLSVILFEKLGLPAKKKTKSGYSTNAEVLDSLRDKHPIIPHILSYRQLAKLKSTYVDGLLKVVGADGRVHTSFQQTETRTGRISSVEPNMQNIPVRTEIGSNLRMFFHAGGGKTLVDADYSQIELRVLAHIANDANMIAAFCSGEDIHTQTAAQVFDLPPDFVTPLLRSRAKAVNFGIVYGIGAYSLSQDIGVSVAEADSYIKGYLRTYSGVKAYMDDTKAKAAKEGYVTTLFGRRRDLPELAASNHNTKAFGERVAMNTPIQGTAADIIKIAMVRVYRRLKAEQLASRLILQVHDELIVECPEDEVAYISTLLREEMEGAVQLAVPMVVDVGTGHTWFDAK